MKKIEFEQLIERGNFEYINNKFVCTDDLNVTIEMVGKGNFIEYDKYPFLKDSYKAKEIMLCYKYRDITIIEKEALFLEILDNIFYLPIPSYCHENGHPINIKDKKSDLKVYHHFNSNEIKSLNKTLMGGITVYRMFESINEINELDSVIINEKSIS